IAALLALYLLYESTQTTVSPTITLKWTLALFIVAFVVSLLAGLREARIRANLAEEQLKALSDSWPRIVSVAHRTSPLVDRRPGTDGHHVQDALPLLQLRFKNRPLNRVGEASIARRVTATVEFWEEKLDQLITRFEGRWPVTTAAEHVGYDGTNPTADFEVNE